MSAPPLDRRLREYLLTIVDVSERDLDKLIEELRDHWSETREEYVRRRHRELQRAGLRNDISYRQICEEVAERRFAARSLSERQVRRIIYG